MMLFESSPSSAFWIVLSYSVTRAYSVGDFEKCISLFRYFSLFCYLELQSTFLIFFSIAVFSPYFLLVGLLLQYVALFQSRELLWTIK